MCFCNILSFIYCKKIKIIHNCVSVFIILKSLIYYTITMYRNAGNKLLLPCL